MTIKKDSLYIGGQWTPSAGSRTIEVISPHTEELVATVPELDSGGLDRAVAAARRAIDDGPWPRTSPAERADVIRAISKAIGSRADEFADTATMEMGSPRSFALAGHVFASMIVLDRFADLLDTFPFEEERPGLGRNCRIVKQPVGVSLAIAPWNVPLFIISMKLGACLAAGAAMIVKSAPEAPLTGYLLAEVLDSVGLPPGVVSVVTADREMSETMVRHAGIDKVSFTGSTAVGRRIGGICGEQLKRCTLELGGKSAAIVLEDADLAAAIPQLLPAAFMNSGQACVAQTRVLVPRHRQDELVQGLADAVSKIKVGDPADPETFVGPLVAERQRTRVEGLIEVGVSEGARLVSGGGRPKGLPRGWYVEPTLFADVENGMRIAREEIFGPVLSVLPYDSEDEAVRIANDSDYGLSGSVWTGDVEHGMALGKRIRTGTFAVNSGAVLDLMNPFGGFKNSGLGRELGREGLEAYLETQTLIPPAAGRRSECDGRGSTRAPMTAPTLPQYNLAAVSEAVAEGAPDRAAIVFRDRRITHAQLAERTRQLAHVLHDRGLGTRPGERNSRQRHESDQDHLAVYLHNGNEYLEAMIGAFKARVVPVNVNYRYVAGELSHVLQKSGAKAIVYHSAFAPVLAEVLPALPEARVLLQVQDESNNELLPGAEWYENAVSEASKDLPAWADEWSPEDLYMVFTGGTTGLPKGVLWRHADIHRTAMGGRHPVSRQPWTSLKELTAFAADNSSPQVVLAASPYMHGAGHWTAFLALNQGGTVVIQDNVERLDPADICSVMQRARVTYLQIVGDAFARPIVDELESRPYDLTSLRTILSGGTALTPPIKSRLLELLPQLTLIESVGSSEGGGQGIQLSTAGGTISTGTFSPVEGSVVVSADFDRLLTAGEDEIGWLAKRGDIPVGYLGDPQATARTFPVVAGERMVVPGDRAQWLADGTIRLLGRDSATINSGGEKIFAEEVEAAIAAHPAVADVVVGSRPSERWGQEVVAIVQLHEGASASPDELAAKAATQLARYKLPKSWVFVDAVQRTAAGKADYRWAAQLAATAG